MDERVIGSVMDLFFKTPSLQFASFKTFKNVVHFTTTRQGGCSGGTFGTFNLGYYSGDIREHVDTNRRILCEILAVNPDRLFVPHQMHGTEIVVIGQDFLHIDKKRQTALLEGKDALLTSCRDVCIAVSTADCVPVLLYAADKQVVGAVHAGWRGTCLRIVESTVKKMIAEFGCDPVNIHAAIGPSIGPDAFEVGEEVFLAFRDSGFDMGAIAFVHPDTGKYHINLWEANYLQLTAAGIPRQQIEIAGICTRNYSDIFFSARGLGTDSGRMLTGICLR